MSQHYQHQQLIHRRRCCKGSTTCLQGHQKHQKLVLLLGMASACLLHHPRFVIGFAPLLPSSSSSFARHRRPLVLVESSSSKSSSSSLPHISCDDGPTPVASLSSVEETTDGDQRAGTGTGTNGVDDEYHDEAPDIELPHSEVATRTRPDFDILYSTVTDNHVPLVYMDSAATSQKPKPVLDRLQQFYSQINANVHRGAHFLSCEATYAYEEARDTVALFIHAPSRNEIVFTSGATDAMNLVVQSYGRAFLQEGDEVILTVAEHHANLVPWHILAKEKGIVLRFVNLDPETGGMDVAHMESLLNEKTKFVAFQHVSNVLACINPVKEIVSKIRAKAAPEAKVLLDACQSVPHMKVDVQDLDVDFLAASGHKMCGPTGIGFLWGREDLLNSMPPWKGGGEMIDTVTLEGSTFVEAPGRFEAGTPPIAQAIGLGAAIDYLQDIGMDQIQAYEHELAKYLFERLSTVPGITILGPQDPNQRAALCSFVHDRVHPSDLSSFLDMEGIAIRAGHHCCQPLHTYLGHSHSARASCSFYNTKEDVDNFIKHMKSTLKFFEHMESPDAAENDDDEDDFEPFV